ncbi:MAG: hypothetical protein II656_05050 [Ruminococcus sp.]|nr:hypothetical protein [Ruminococcus sp.]
MTQAERVREYIKTNGSITPIEATVDLGIIDLARTISYMRKQGDTDIVGRPEKAKNRFGEPVRYYRYSFRKDGEQ